MQAYFLSELQGTMSDNNKGFVDTVKDTLSSIGNAISNAVDKALEYDAKGREFVYGENGGFGISHSDF